MLPPSDYQALKERIDLDFDFLGIQTMYDRYLIIDKTRKPSRRIETPQFFWMRVSMGLMLDEKGDRENRVAASFDRLQRGQRDGAPFGEQEHARGVDGLFGVVVGEHDGAPRGVRRPGRGKAQGSQGPAVGKG